MLIVAASPCQLQHNYSCSSVIKVQQWQTAGAQGVRGTAIEHYTDHLMPNSEVSMPHKLQESS